MLLGSGVCDDGIDPVEHGLCGCDKLVHLIHRLIDPRC